MTDSDSSTSIILNIPRTAPLVSKAGTRGELFGMHRMVTVLAVKIDLFLHFLRANMEPTGGFLLPCDLMCSWY